MRFGLYILCFASYFLLVSCQPNRDSASDVPLAVKELHDPATLANVLSIPIDEVKIEADKSSLPAPFAGGAPVAFAARGFYDKKDQGTGGGSQGALKPARTGNDDDDDNCHPVYDEDLGSALNNMQDPVATGTTIGRPRNFNATCGFVDASPDFAYKWTAPADGIYQFDTFGSNYDTVLHLRSYPDCSNELDCNDDTPLSESVQSSIIYEFTAGRMILIVIDGYDGDVGNFVLNIQPVTTQCSDTIDNDDDGDTDFPADQQCTSNIDNDESGNIQTAIRPKPPKRP